MFGLGDRQCRIGGAWPAPVDDSDESLEHVDQFVGTAENAPLLVGPVAFIDQSRVEMARSNSYRWTRRVSVKTNNPIKNAPINPSTAESPSTNTDVLSGGPSTNETNDWKENVSVSRILGWLVIKLLFRYRNPNPTIVTTEETTTRYGCSPYPAVPANNSERAHLDSAFNRVSTPAFSCVDVAV